MGADGLEMVKSIAARLPAQAWLVFGGLFVALLAGVLLPFFTVKNTLAGSVVSSVDVANTGVVKFVVVVLVAGAAWLAWPLLTGSRMPANRLIGLTVVIGILIAGAGLDALINEVFSSSGSDEFVSVDVMPGFGLLLYGAAMVAATIGVVMIWAQRSKTPGPPV